jgi:hypothetical protein
MNKGQSACGDLDPSQGDGHFSFADGTAIYELSHLLNSTEPEDISASPVNDTVWFFLTLRTGKGAHGNTQRPGFQEYQDITTSVPGSN